MTDFTRFPRGRKHVHEYADVRPQGTDGIGREHAAVIVPRYYGDGGTLLCMIHLPKTEHQQYLEHKLSDQHYLIGKQKDRIRMLEAYITGLGFAVTKEQA